MSSYLPPVTLAQSAGPRGQHAVPQTAPPGLRADNSNGHPADTSAARAVQAESAPGAPASGQLPLDMADWDVMFEAVQARLIRAVGHRLGELPNTPQHSAELSASLVQAVVLDCVSALDHLHTALKLERSQRLTP